jgi:hypothetical protein
MYYGVVVRASRNSDLGLRHMHGVLPPRSTCGLSGLHLISFLRAFFSLNSLTNSSNSSIIPSVPNVSWTCMFSRCSNSSKALWIFRDVVIHPSQRRCAIDGSSWMYCVKAYNGEEVFLALGSVSTFLSALLLADQLLGSVGCTTGDIDAADFEVLDVSRNKCQKVNNLNDYIAIFKIFFQCHLSTICSHLFISPQVALLSTFYVAGETCNTMRSTYDESTFRNYILQYLRSLRCVHV